MKCLNADEVIKHMTVLDPSWELHVNAIQRKFVFKDFKNAFSFMSAVAAIAEKLNHHPDWTNNYNTVIIKLNTNDLGCLTELDFIFAREIDILN
ncbi:4a-hydroxytetrahydrobiopterin dehydratase [Sediminibacterium salmoneum]|uniref:4a-hydroxytetrahydrobiopterin dehydratase n=1 Tax=Sediminibacterium salmoneum TaxID=426421 RepID=UPI000478EDC5|nr:4a-hydroxytetrahydrobiopterin dehydratase [Sediminibacterium salmoneum]